MEPSGLKRNAAASNTLDDSMQFTSNYSIIARDERSFIRRNNIQDTQSSLTGIDMGDLSWAVPDEISLFQSKIFNTNSSRLPPEGAERKARRGANNESLDVSRLSNCSQYKELLEFVNKYDLDDVSVSEIPDKILPPAGGQSYRDRINKRRAEGTDIFVPSTEQLLAVLKDSEGLTPTKIYDRIMESSYPKNLKSKLSESDMDLTSCDLAKPVKISAPQTIDKTFNVTSEFNRIDESSTSIRKMADSSFVVMSNSILDKDEKSFMEKYAALPKQADITCPPDQSTLPWNVSNVTIFDLDATGSLPSQNSMPKLTERNGMKAFQNDTSRLDDLAERIYNLSPSTSFSSISKMIVDSTRSNDSAPLNWSSLVEHHQPK